jgi:hypothetical protein
VKETTPLPFWMNRMSGVRPWCPATSTMSFISYRYSPEALVT